MSNFENTLHAWRSRQHESATIGPAGLLILGKEWWKRMLDPALWERKSVFFTLHIYIHIYIYIYLVLMSSLPSPKLCQSVEGKIQPAAQRTGYEAPVGILFIAHETKTWASGDLKSCLTASQQAWWGSLEIAVMQDVSTNNTNITMGESTRSSQIRG